MAFEQLLPFKQRWGHACVTAAEADKIYLVGGENEAERRAFADVWCSWDGASTWRLMHDPAAKQKAGTSKVEHDIEQRMPGRRGHACAVTPVTIPLSIVAVNDAPIPAPLPTLTVIVFVVAFVIAVCIPATGSVVLG